MLLPPRATTTLTTVLLALAAPSLVADDTAIGAPATTPRPTARGTLQRLPDGNALIDGVTVRAAQRELAFPGRFALKEGALEVIIARPNGRLHETLLVTDVSAVAVQTALYLLRARNGARTDQNPKLRQGTLVDIDIEWTDDQDTPHRSPVEDWIRDLRTQQPLKRLGWTFTGSGIHQGQFLADAEGNIVINWSQGATVLDSPDPESVSDTLHAILETRPQPTRHPNVTIVLKPRLP